MAGKLSGRTILVTGASQGIGAEVAKHCAAEGATVILVARRQKRMEKVLPPVRPNLLPSASTSSRQKKTNSPNWPPP